jgi:hypothetical protein
VPEGTGTRATISTTWTPQPGLRGVLERLFTPTLLRRIYVQELALLADHAPSLAASGASGAVAVNR